MNPREFLAKRKVHLFFVCGFFLALAFSIILGLTSGQTVRGATWKAISEIRPLDYLMFALFWYACAVHRPKDDWDTSLTGLNLSRSNNQK